jgi:hypothetical protein
MYASSQLSDFASIPAVDKLPELPPGQHVYLSSCQPNQCLASFSKGDGKACGDCTAAGSAVLPSDGVFSDQMQKLFESSR